MTEKERGQLARDIGYEAACGAMHKIQEACDGDVGVLFAAQAWVAYMLMAWRDSDTMLNTYPSTTRFDVEDVDS